MSVDITHPVRIEADGPGGRVFIGETNYSGMISKADVSLGCDMVPTVTLTLATLNLVTMGEMRVRWKDGAGKHIRYIEFEDGTTFGLPSVSDPVL